jgi:hypothetical protein
MTFEECCKLREEIAARVGNIQRKLDLERTISSPDIHDLRNYCRQIYPRFKGQFGNVGQKIVEMTEAASKAIDNGDITLFSRALLGIDHAVRLHRPKIDEAGGR